MKAALNEPLKRYRKTNFGGRLKEPLTNNCKKGRVVRATARRPYPNNELWDVLWPTDFRMLSHPLNDGPVRRGVLPREAMDLLEQIPRRVGLRDRKRGGYRLR